MEDNDEEIVLELILENIPYFVFWKDRDSNYLGCNQLFASVAGFKNSGDIVGKTDYDCSWTKEESDFFRKVDQKVMDDGVKILNIEEPQNQADGITKTLLTSKVPLFDSSGKVNGILGIYTDITDRKLLEHEKEQALTDLEATMDKLVAQEKLASLGSLSAGIAHEIRNPLNLINNSAEMISESVSVNLKKIISRASNIDEELKNEINEEIEGADSMIDILMNNTRRLEAIVDSMMKQSSSDTVTKEFYDINKLITEQANLSFQSMKASSPNNCLMEINLVPIDDILLNFQSISRVISNLTNNSFYTLIEKSSLGLDDYEPKLEIKTFIKNNHLYISFFDNGLGISSNIINKVLEPFFTTKASGVGAGLGLSMVNDIIVQLHGGNFEIKSEEGQYTEMIVSIPISNNN